MNRAEHLLTILGEEGNEIAHRASKANRFGINEVQAGRTQSNAELLVGEINDLLGLVEMLQEEGLIGPVGDRAAMDAKKAKVEAYLVYSRECGTLQ